MSMQRFRETLEMLLSEYSEDSFGYSGGLVESLQSGSLKFSFLWTKTKISAKIF